MSHLFGDVQQLAWDHQAVDHNDRQLELPVVRNHRSRHQPVMRPRRLCFVKVAIDDHGEMRWRNINGSRSGAKHAFRRSLFFRTSGKPADEKCSDEPKAANDHWICEK